MIEQERKLKLLSLNDSIRFFLAPLNKYSRSSLFVTVLEGRVAACAGVAVVAQHKRRLSAWRRFSRGSP